MTLLAPSAPLITVAHDWTSPPEREVTFPTRVLTQETGDEQRIGLSNVATEVMTYRLLTPKYGDAAGLKTLLEEAVDALVRIPRWEDRALIDPAGVSAGDVTIPCDTTDKPTFVADAEVLIWRSPSLYEVAVIDTVGSSSIDIVSPLASDWGPGTKVVPINEARVRLPISLTHWHPTTGALTIAFEVGLRDLAGLGSGGTSTATSVADITVSVRYPVGQNSGIYYGARVLVIAEATDAAGELVPDAPIVWTTSAPGDLAVWPTLTPTHAVISSTRVTVGVNTVSVIATVGAVSSYIPVEVWN